MSTISLAELYNAAPLMRDALKQIKIRICYIGHPKEPRDQDGQKTWAKEIALLEDALFEADKTAIKERARLGEETLDTQHPTHSRMTIALKNILVRAQCRSVPPGELLKDIAIFATEALA